MRLDILTKCPCYMDYLHLLYQQCKICYDTKHCMSENAKTKDENATFTETLAKAYPASSSMKSLTLCNDFLLPKKQKMKHHSFKYITIK